MTTIRSFTHRRHSIRLLVLAMAVVLIALAGAMPACGPATPAPPGVGETATNVAFSDQQPSDGTDPIHVQQPSDDGTSTPLPTICADTVDAKGNPIKDCGPPPPMSGEEKRNIDGALMSLVEDAQKAQEDRQRSGGQDELVPTKRYRVLIQLTHDNDGQAIIDWLEERGYSYTDHSDRDEIFAGVDLIAIPGLSKVEGVFRLTEALENVPG